MPGYETLKVEQRGPVGWLVNNRPDQLNAMSSRMRDELADAWLELDADPAVRVIVHTGEGRAFQTGVDLQELSGDGVGVERYRDSVVEWDLHFTAWHQHVQKPVITAVNGIYAGGGLHFVADADIVIAASDAQFVDPHVSVGQVTALEAIGLARKVPFEAVMRMALLGRHERMSATARTSWAWSRRSSTRPSGCAKSRRSWPRRSPATPPPPSAPPSARSKGRSSAVSPRAVAPAPGSWSRCGDTPTRPRAPWHSRRRREPRWAGLD